MIKADLHSHAFVTLDRGRLSLERFPRTLDTILFHMEKKGMNCLGLTDSKDERYLAIRRTARDSKARVVEDIGSAFIVDYNGTDYVVVHAQEVATRQGDLIVLGNINNLPDNEDAKETFKRVGDTGSLCEIPHAFLKDGIGIRGLEEFRGQYDAMETFNGNCRLLLPYFLDLRKLNKQAEEYAKENDIPGIAISDSHRPKDIGRAYFESEYNLDFSSRESFNTILRNMIKQEKTNRGRYISWYGIARMMAVSVYDIKIRRKLGLVRTNFTSL